MNIDMSKLSAKVTPPADPPPDLAEAPTIGPIILPSTSSQKRTVQQVEFVQHAENNGSQHINMASTPPAEKKVRYEPIPVEAVTPVTPHMAFSNIRPVAPRRRRRTPPKKKLILRTSKDVLTLAFQFLDLDMKLTVCPLVCQEWREISKSPGAWLYVNLEPFKSIVNNQRIAALAPRLSAVTHINLFECYDVYDMGIDTLAKHAPNLREINLTGCNLVTDESLKSISRHCRSLRVINLTCCMKITDKGMAFLVSGCVKLRSIKLWGCQFITDVSLFHTGTYALDLECLDLTWCKLITEQGFKHLQTCKKLQQLNVMWCERVKDTCLINLRGLNKLTWLNIDGCGRITDSGLDALASYCPKLTFFSCRFLSKITIPGVTHFIKRCRNLKLLDCRNCDLINDTFKKTVVDNLNRVAIHF